MKRGWNDHKLNTTKYAKQGKIEETHTLKYYKIVSIALSNLLKRTKREQKAPPG